MKQNSIMSVDVEEWFHIPEGTDNILEFDKWDGAVERVQHVMPVIFDIFERNRVTATFFFLGWVAEKHPSLVKEALRRGHEVATHGYAHKLVYKMSPGEFEKDLHRAKSIIEDIGGEKVKGYRAPGFSITPETVWAFDILVKNGFSYDSSVFPGKRAYGHFDRFSLVPVKIETVTGIIFEFPQSVVDWGVLRFSCFGGGYFRLFPGFFFLSMAKRIQKNGRPLIVYLHPKDIDPGQPRIDFGYARRLRHYINIEGAAGKLDKVTSCLSFTSFEKILTDPAFHNDTRSIHISAI